MRAAVILNGYIFASIEDALNACGARLIYHETGDDLNPAVSFDRLSRQKPDVTVVDADVFYNGYDFVRSMRRYKSLTDSRIIVLTRNAEKMAEVFRALIAMGIFDICIYEGSGYENNVASRIESLLRKPRSLADWQAYNAGGSGTIGHEPAREPKRAGGGANQLGRAVPKRTDGNDRIVDIPVTRHTSGGDPYADKPAPIQVDKNENFADKPAPRWVEKNEHLADKPAPMRVDKHENFADKPAPRQAGVGTNNGVEKMRPAAGAIGTPAIAVCSVEQGSGSAYTALLLAKYLEKIGYRVAVNAFDANGALARLAGSEECRRCGDGVTGGFIYKKVTIFIDKKIGDIVNLGFDYLVLDIGSLEQPLASRGVVDEINRSALRLLVSGVSPWSIMDLSDLLNLEENPEKKWAVAFTGVPDSKHKEIGALMRGYSYHILPAIDIDDGIHDDIIAEMLSPVLMGGERRRRGFAVLR